MRYAFLIFKIREGNFLVIQGLGLRTSTAMGQSSIPGQGTKIPQAKKKKKISEDLSIVRTNSFTRTLEQQITLETFLKDSVNQRSITAK